MSQQLKALVVDDEPLAQDLVVSYVRRVPFLTLVGCYSTASEAAEVINSESVDVLFIDIQMPGISGLSFSKSLPTDKRPKIIFTTAYSEYAVDGFKCDATDYLLKPFDFDEFLRAATKAKRQIELEASSATEPQSPQCDAASDDFFFVKSDYKLVKIEVANIRYVEGLKDYVKIFMTDNAKPILTLSTLKQIEARLERFSFVRIHRSYIVNVKMITGVEKGGLFVGTMRLPVGDGYKANIQSIVERLTL